MREGLALMHQLPSALIATKRVVRNIASPERTVFDARSTGIYIYFSSREAGAIVWIAVIFILVGVIEAREQGSTFLATPGVMCCWFLTKRL